MEVLTVCHAHSRWSYDGSWSLEELSAKFRGHGCRVLMMTEHDRGFTAERLEQYRAACVKASSSELLVVPGIEYSDADNRVHVLVWGPVPFLGEGLRTSEMLESVRAANGVAVLAHPSRKKAWEKFEPYWAERLLGSKCGIGNMMAGRPARPLPRYSISLRHFRLWDWISILIANHFRCSWRSTSGKM
jgi:hypothetical protein